MNDNPHAIGPGHKVPDTQLAAYELVLGDIQRREIAVLEAVRALAVRATDGVPGAALFEIAAHLGVEMHTVSGRVTNLRKQGRLRDSGHRRRNPRGNSGIVWVAA